MVFVLSVILVIMVVGIVILLLEVSTSHAIIDTLEKSVSRLRHDKQELQDKPPTQVKTIIPMESVQPQARTIIPSMFSVRYIIETTYEKMPADAGTQGVPTLTIYQQDNRVVVSDKYLDDFVLGVNAAYKAARSTEANVTERVDKPS